MKLSGKNLKPWTSLLLVLALLVTGLLSLTGNQSASRTQSILGIIQNLLVDPELVTLTKVVDGDTIKVIYQGKEETVRLVGIDTPETKHPSKEVECFGPEASEYLGKLLEGQDFELVFDSKQGQRDRYERLLAYLYLPDGRLVNQIMVAEGYAFAYTKAKSDLVDTFVLEEQKAQAEGKGLWGSCEY